MTHPSMIVLYHCVSARSFRPLWMLEELGLPYELRMLPFPPRMHARSYLDQNPLGTVPLLEDGATRITESAAMCQYLAARHSPGVLDVPVHEPAYGAYLNWRDTLQAVWTCRRCVAYSRRLLRNGRCPQCRRRPRGCKRYSVHRIVACYDRKNSGATVRGIGDRLEPDR